MEELKQQYKELEQTKIDNITAEFESWVDYISAVKDSSQALIDYYTAAGRAINTPQDQQLYKDQISRQDEITQKLSGELSALRAELSTAASVFGTNSNEYRALLATVEQTNKALIDSRKATIDLKRTAWDLDSTVRGYLITRVKAFVDKLSSIAGLAEKRGTRNVYHTDTSRGIPTQVTEKMYSDQQAFNTDLILKYYEDIKEAQKTIKEFGYDINNPNYEELYKTITDDEQAIIQLLSANEDLAESIRNLRWQPYAKFREELDHISSDLDHIGSFIRDGEILDEDGQLTDRGYTQIAIIGEQMDVAERKIRNAEEAIAKLDEERENYTISLEKYNEELETQLGIIQDAAGDLFDDQTRLADIYIDRITKENDILQDLIQSRRDALDAKKE